MIPQLNDRCYSKGRYYIWGICPDCNDEGRWIQFDNTYFYRPKYDWYCRRHAMSKMQRERPRRANAFVNCCGYKFIPLPLEHPFACMVQPSKTKGKGGYVLEHRLIMAEKLGRPLETCESIHHLNGIKDDNRPENLALTTNLTHEHNTRVRLLEKRVKELEEKLHGY